MQRLFYATADDLIAVFEHVESKHRLAYTLCGLFMSPEFQSYPSGAALPSLLEPAAHPNAIAGAQYLITPADQSVVVREVPQMAGGLRYAIDQFVNPDSITIQHLCLFRFGRIFGPDDWLFHDWLRFIADGRDHSRILRWFVRFAVSLFVPSFAEAKDRMTNLMILRPLG